MVPRSLLKPGLIALMYAGTWARAMDRVPGTIPGLPAPANFGVAVPAAPMIFGDLTSFAVGTPIVLRGFPSMAPQLPGSKPVERKDEGPLAPPPPPDNPVSRLPVEAWKGPRPDDQGAFAHGEPVSLLVAAIQDYRARGDTRENHRDVLKGYREIAERWQTAALGSKPRPFVGYYEDGAVNPGLFAGPGALCTRFDLVLFGGHGSAHGPWLGAHEDKHMNPDHYNWSGDRMRWFVNASCNGLYDGKDGGEPDALALSRWDKAMGHTPPMADRLHALLAFRSHSFQTWDVSASGGSWISSWSYSTEGRYRINPVSLFIGLLLRSDNEAKASGEPHTIGEAWFHAARQNFAFNGSTGLEPGVYAWVATRGTGPTKETLDYFEESFHAPFPSPGRLDPAYELALKCRYLTIGKPVFR
ncbi:MAG: hypothetical protein HGA66_17670 [Holophaga sp.]|nr:hypothetical protein [Holophaga sp.]